MLHLEQKKLGRSFEQPSFGFGSACYGQGCRPAADELDEPEPLALPDIPDEEPEDDPIPEPEDEPDDDAMPEPVVDPLVEPGGTAALFSFGCCVTGSRQCVAGDTLAPGELVDDEPDCALAETTPSPTKVEASKKALK